MNTDMKLQKVPVEKLKPAKYNPRKDLKPGDPAYEKIKRSMTTYGYVDPVIWNEVTGNIVGGHQRYKVLVAEGVKEIDCVVVHIENPQDEKALNIALNKAVGEWEPKALRAGGRCLDAGPPSHGVRRLYTAAESCPAHERQQSQLGCYRPAVQRVHCWPHQGCAHHPE